MEGAPPTRAPCVALAWSFEEARQVFMSLASWRDGSGWTFSTKNVRTPVAVGVAPHLSFLERGGTESNASAATAGVLMLVHGEGFCQNNEAQNKNAKTSVCEQTPVHSGCARLQLWLEQRLGEAANKRRHNERVRQPHYARCL